MRWSSAFIPTLREDPADAEAASHRLLVRAGFIRQLAAGVYSLLPLGFRVCQRITGIVREEMNGIGGQEFRLPALHPVEIWQRSGRWAIMGEELFRLQDRRGADLVLGMTHEEVLALLATEVRSYRQLPEIWYQIQTKFRDEPRPRSGVLRTREFTMKDSYSLDLDREGLDRAFDAHHGAYLRIFTRMGLDPIPVVASSGAMGGSESTEFMVLSAAGEDRIAHCRACGYAANVEKAASRLAEVEDQPGPAAPERVATPGVRTIEGLARFPEGAPADRQIKTMVYLLEETPALVLLRGDHALAEAKLQEGTGAQTLRPAHPDEIRDLMGASPGSLGAVGVTGIRVVADVALRGRRDLMTGANEDDFHLRGVDVERDIPVDEWLDLREVKAGEPCPECGEPLVVDAAIEVGHIFKLGTRYSEAMGATVLDESGKARPIVMGCYGIGVERGMAAVVEASHDEKGIVWPLSVAPYDLVVSVLNPEGETLSVGESIYRELAAEGLEVLLDDRAERPGVKFADAELVGFPFRLTVGPKGLADGKVDLVRRRDGRSESLEVARAAATVAETLAKER